MNFRKRGEGKEEGRKKGKERREKEKKREKEKEKKKRKNLNDTMRNSRVSFQKNGSILERGKRKEGKGIREWWERKNG